MLKLRFFIFTIIVAITSMATAAGFTRNGNCVSISIDKPDKDGAKIVCLEVINA